MNPIAPNTTTYRGRFRRPRRATALLILCAMALTGNGCATGGALHTGPAAFSDLKPGDNAIVYLNDGSSMQLKVISWADGILVGKDRSKQTHTINRSDIDSLQLVGSDASHTALLVAGIVLAAALIYSASQADATLPGFE